MSETKQTPSATQPMYCYSTQVQALQTRLKQLNPEQRSNRAREIAKHLGIAEVQWVAASLDRLLSRELNGSPRDILHRVAELGEVTAITRNDACVHELTGAYPALSVDRQVLLGQGEPIDVRLFVEAIQTSWAVVELGRCSLQFFDRTGAAVHKIYCTAATNMVAYQQIVDDYATEDASWPQLCAPAYPAISSHVEQPQVLRQAWLALKDTHDFYGLIKRFKVTRVAAFKAVGIDLAQRVHASAVEEVLKDVAIRLLPIMCFVSSPAAVQIYTGTIHTLYQKGQWYNVIDPNFNLHLDTAAIGSVWVVSKPTVDGWVTSLEVYDRAEQLIVQFFGSRKPGEPELAEWRDVLRANCSAPLISCREAAVG